MTVDAPARIAVIGAGPMGIEAALYGRFLGYDVQVFETGEVGQRLRDRGNLLLDGTFRGIASSLGRAALQAQQSDHRLPALDARVTRDQFRTLYLVPLSQSDLLASRIRSSTRVTHVARFETEGGGAGDARTYRLNIVDSDGESSQDFEVVIDATGGIGTDHDLTANLERWIPCDIPSPVIDDVRLYAIGTPRLIEETTLPDERFDQIRHVFCRLVGRPDLDVYANMRRMLDS